MGRGPRSVGIVVEIDALVHCVRVPSQGSQGEVDPVFDTSFLVSLVLVHLLLQLVVVSERCCCSLVPGEFVQATDSNSEVPLAVRMQLLVLPQSDQFALPHQEQYHTRACELRQVTELEHNVDHDRCVGDP